MKPAVMAAVAAGAVEVAVVVVAAVDERAAALMKGRAGRIISVGNEKLVVDE